MIIRSRIHLKVTHISMVNVPSVMSLAVMFRILLLNLKMMVFSYVIMNFDLFFYRENFSRHIYQGVLDYASKVGINNADIQDIMLSSAPHITTPNKVDHESIQFFLRGCICKTSKHTTPKIRKSSSTYIYL